MTDEQWERIRARISAAWPWEPLDGEAATLYREVLDDLSPPDVSDAITALVRRGVNECPPPGTLRRATLGTLEAPPPPEAPTRDPAVSDAAAPRTPPDDGARTHEPDAAPRAGTSAPAGGDPAPSAEEPARPAGLPPLTDSKGPGAGWALVLAIAFAPVGLILGILAWRGSDAGTRERGMAVAAVVIGGVLTAIAAFGVVNLIADRRSESDARALEESIVQEGDFASGDLRITPRAADCAPEGDDVFLCVIEFTDDTRRAYRVVVRSDGGWVADPTFG